MPYCPTDIKIEVLSFWKSLPHAGEKWFHLGQNFIFYHCKQKRSLLMWWACLFPVVWFMLMLLELTHPPFLDGDSFSCQTWWWIIGVGWVFFPFFLSVKMYSCQHSVGPSLITPRLVVLWSTPFYPLLSKTTHHGILLGFWGCEQKHPNMLAWMRQWDPVGPQFKNLFIVCKPFMSRARQSIFLASWASLWISVATGADNV